MADLRVGQAREGQTAQSSKNGIQHLGVGAGVVARAHIDDGAVVIENDGSVADLQGRVDEQWNELQRRIARRAGS